MDTTGQIVLAYTESGARLIVAEDAGPYPNCRAEYNVRKLRIIEQFDLTVASPTWHAVTARKQGYGCGWGDTSVLYPVTENDIEALRREVVAKKVAAAMTKALCA